MGIGTSVNRLRTNDTAQDPYMLFTPAAVSFAEAPHNCVGGSEVNCLPGAAEAAIMFADPSKMQNVGGVPAPSHW